MVYIDVVMRVPPGKREEVPLLFHLRTQRDLLLRGDIQVPEVGDPGTTLGYKVEESEPQRPTRLLVTRTSVLTEGLSSHGHKCVTTLLASSRQSPSKDCIESEDPRRNRRCYGHKDKQLTRATHITQSARRIKSSRRSTIYDLINTSINMDT